MLGKKLYKTTALFSIKVMSVMTSVVLLLNLYFQTYNDIVFTKQNVSGFKSILEFNLFYPEELIIYLLFILFPCAYYGFIRGAIFYENGVVINRGLPFFNTTVLYKNISKYEIIHPKYFMSVKNRETEDEILFSINSVDRVVAIFDQNNINGILESTIKKDFKTHKKLILFFVLSGVIVGFIQYSGVIRELFR